MLIPRCRQIMFAASFLPATGMAILGTAAPADAEVRPDEMALWLTASSARRKAPASRKLVHDTLMSYFVVHDRDGGGISMRDCSYRHQLRLASWRARYMSSWLRYDIDNDGYVTKAEINLVLTPLLNLLRLPKIGRRQQQAERRAAAIRRFIANIFAWDRDGDGRVSFAEARAGTHARVVTRYGDQRTDRSCLQYLRFDLNGDGTATATEFSSVLSRVLRAIDRDNDAQITREEIDALKPAIDSIRRKLTCPSQSGPG